MKKMNVLDVASKIEWEGGINETIVAGYCKPEEIEDPELSDLFKKAYKAYSKYKKISDKIWKIVSTHCPDM